MANTGVILRDMASAFAQLGFGLTNTPHSVDARILSDQLISTSEVFSRLGGIDLSVESFSPDERNRFIRGITELATIARAAGNRDHRTDELLQEVGNTADRVGLRDRFDGVATELVQLLIEFPGGA